MLSKGLWETRGRREEAAAASAAIAGSEPDPAGRGGGSELSGLRGGGKTGDCSGSTSIGSASTGVAAASSAVRVAVVRRLTTGSAGVTSSSSSLPISSRKGCGPGIGVASAGSLGTLGAWECGGLLGEVFSSASWAAATRVP
jgi:hypothetical protein